MTSSNTLTSQIGYAIDAMDEVVRHIDRQSQALNDIYEVWAGSDGFDAETPRERFLMQQIIEMRDIAGENK